MKTPLKNRLRIHSNHFAIIPSRQVLKTKGIYFGAEGRGRARVQAEIIQFIALPFPSSKKLKIWSFHVVVVQGRQRNVQKRVMHVRSCCFAVAFAVAVLA